MSRPLLILAILVATLALVGGCKGCRTQQPNTEGDASVPPTVRLYLMSDLAGALEPCGCTNGQLGGLDHLAAFVKSEREAAPEALVLAAGPLLHAEARLGGDHATQARWKAEAVAGALAHIGLHAWAPGYNDWADGAEALGKLADVAGARMVGVGLGTKGAVASDLATVGKTKIGIIGASIPAGTTGALPEGVSAPDPSRAAERVGEEAERLRQRGARVLVVLAAMQRGAALRIAEAVPSIHVMLVAKPISVSHANTQQPAPEHVGNTLVIETANHGQTVAVVDLSLREGDGPLVLEDADGVEKAAEIAALSERIRDLELRIRSWRQGGKVAEADLHAREAELDGLRAERARLEVPSAAPEGSFFRYRVQQVGEGLGEHPEVAALMRAYYERVNEHNREAFADRAPPAPKDGEAGYVGVDTCKKCHPAAYDVWTKTSHAQAYRTLERDHKEYNLDCVGCHVTGYARPGGSTVTHNDDLRDVQCEVCHGPGSLHADDPDDGRHIEPRPSKGICAARCHHPPHVEGWNVDDKIGLILGRGHGG